MPEEDNTLSHLMQLLNVGIYTDIKQLAFSGQLSAFGEYKIRVYG
jgi:hypothetical protein